MTHKQAQWIYPKSHFYGAGVFWPDNSWLAEIQSKVPKDTSDEHMLGGNFYYKGSDCEKEAQIVIEWCSPKIRIVQHHPRMRRG